MFPWFFAVVLFSSISAYHGFDPLQEIQRGRRINIEGPNAADHGLISWQPSHDDVLNRRNFVSQATHSIAIPYASESLFPAADRTMSMDPGGFGLTSSALSCLLDLPPYDPKSTVRLYLCRHGETENNRLNIIQGARIDPPINGNGLQQAKLLGLALSNASFTPSLVVYSPLLRAKQTAQVVTEQLLARKCSKSIRIRMRLLKDLAEVDFGSMAEGAPVSQYRSELISLYGSWALGNLSARMPGGGESGYEILSRIGSALRFMIEIAARETDSSCLAAITHSSYLRLLIGAVDDFRFFSSATPQNNCGINVIDFPRPKKFFPSNHDANPNENVADNFVPLGKIIRVNERRHLSSIQSDQESSVRSLIKSF